MVHSVGDYLRNGFADRFYNERFKIVFFSDIGYEINE